MLTVNAVLLKQLADIHEITRSGGKVWFRLNFVLQIRTLLILEHFQVLYAMPAVYEAVMAPVLHEVSRNAALWLDLHTAVSHSFFVHAIEAFLAVEPLEVQQACRSFDLSARDGASPD